MDVPREQVDEVITKFESIWYYHEQTEPDGSVIKIPYKIAIYLFKLRGLEMYYIDRHMRYCKKPLYPHPFMGMIDHQKALKQYLLDHQKEVKHNLWLF